MTPRQLVIAIEYWALEKYLKHAKPPNAEAIQFEMDRLALEYEEAHADSPIKPPPPPPPPPPPDF